MDSSTPGFGDQASPGAFVAQKIRKLDQATAQQPRLSSQSVRHAFDGLDADPETRTLVAASIAVDMCRKLRACGIDEFHFYTLSRAEPN